MNCDECGESVPDNLRLCPVCAIPKHSKASGSLAPARGSAFDVWWDNEGSGLRPLPTEDYEEHAHRVCKIAWEAQSCRECGGEGGVDSGGVTPWGSAIMIPCPSCSNHESKLKYRVQQLENELRYCLVLITTNLQCESDLRVEYARSLLTPNEKISEDAGRKH